LAVLALEQEPGKAAGVLRGRPGVSAHEVITNKLLSGR
jgi:hypothetical protein